MRASPKTSGRLNEVIDSSEAGACELCVWYVGVGRDGSGVLTIYFCICLYILISILNLGRILRLLTLQTVSSQWTRQQRFLHLYIKAVLGLRIGIKVD